MGIAGEMIREGRKRVGLSQGRLASLLGVRLATVCDWERGKQAPGLRHLIGLEEKLGIPIVAAALKEEPGRATAPARPRARRGSESSEWRGRLARVSEELEVCFQELEPLIVKPLRAKDLVAKCSGLLRQLDELAGSGGNAADRGGGSSAAGTGKLSAEARGSRGGGPKAPVQGQGGQGPA
jgi:transcriptional regulator with XRE-family HTH domain